MRQIRILFLALLIACDQRSEEQELVSIDTSKPAGHEAHMRASNTASQAHNTVSGEVSEESDNEFLDSNLVRINGQLPFLSDKNELLKLLGKPDSVVTPDMSDICVTYFDKDFKYAYFGQSKFEISGEKAALGSVSFVDKKELQLSAGPTVLDKTTTLEGLKKKFPKAVAGIQDLDVKKLGKVQSVELSISNQPTANKWLLFFLNGNLIRVDYWMPC